MKEAILRHINSTSGIIAQKLLLDLMAEYGPTKLDVAEFNTVVDRLVENGDIVRVQFVIPPCPKTGMRTGALYLPNRSVVFVNTKDDRTIFRKK